MNRIMNIALALTVLVVTGCSTAPKSEADRAQLQSRAQETIARFKQMDPSMGERFNSAAAYAVIPTVGKGAVGVGGAYGRGVLYEGGVMSGYCDMTQGTIGLQLGGQAYSEIIFFKDAAGRLEQFKGGTLKFAAHAGHDEYR